MAREYNKAELKQISVYVDAGTYNKIEKSRGIYSKSSFVAAILADIFSDVPEVKA